MALNPGKRRWPAGVLLLFLAGVFVWIGRRPSPVGSVVQAGGGNAETSASSPSVIPPAKIIPAEPPALEKANEGLSKVVIPAPPAVLPMPVLPFGFPTDNISLVESRAEQFFMFVDRSTPTGQVQVWQGGNYGFVRNPRETAQGTVYTKFHEGIDIAPAARDAKGEPLDEVRAVADGTVGYVTASPRSSNYGNYIVVLHQVGEAGVFYSLYAHLRSTEIAVGTAVRRGQKLGSLGYTGAGIDRRRAHLHFELGLILSERFDAYYAKTSGLANGHGNFHGSNLIGLDAGAFLAAHHADPQVMPHDFLRAQEVYYKVVVPNRGAELELVQRHPWLRQPGPAGSAWEISFTGPGVPVAIYPSPQAVGFASVSWVKPFAGYHSWNTRSLLGGTGATGILTEQGNRFLSLVTGEF